MKRYIYAAEQLPYKLNFEKYGFYRSKKDDFEDDGDHFAAYRFDNPDGPLLTRFYLADGSNGGRGGVATFGDEFISLETVVGDMDDYNGVPMFRNQAEADAALARLAQFAKDSFSEYRDFDSDIVRIVEHGGRLRGLADDGEHGPGYVQMPRALREREGQLYRSLDLRWNGKNYISKQLEPV